MTAHFQLLARRIELEIDQSGRWSLDALATGAQ